jgi:hypothetical protein
VPSFLVNEKELPMLACAGACVIMAVVAQQESVNVPGVGEK